MIWHHGMLSTKYELLSSQTEAFSSEVHSSSSWVQMIWRSNRSFFPVTLETVWGSKLTGHMRSSLSNFHLFVFKRATRHGAAWKILVASFCNRWPAISNLISTECALREGFQEKVAVIFLFCPNYLDPPIPPFPPIWTTCTTFFERQCAKKFGQGSPHPQYIQFVKSGQKIWAGPSPPLIGQNPKEQLLFSGDLPQENPRC